MNSIPQVSLGNVELIFFTYFVGNFYEIGDA